MSALERNLPERVTRLEANMDSVARGIEEIKQEMREIRQETRDFRVEVNARFEHLDSRFDGMYTLMSSWLKWVLGFIFSSWLTLMASLWIKR